MDKVRKVKYYIDSLCIYNLKNDPIIKSMRNLIDSVSDDGVIAKQSELFNLLSKHGSLKKYISMLILTDDNIFTKSAAACKENALDKSVIDAVKSDLMKLEEISSIESADIANAVCDDDVKKILATIPKWETGAAQLPLTENWASETGKLCEYHRVNGYGIFSKYIAFSWKNGTPVPITSTDPIRLTDLKNYERQREQVIENTLAFLDSLPANNVLLYGDRGTGKSSTVHAVLNEYKNRGLRIIEISKGDIGDLTAIREKISDCPMKFIIYIDDLSFDSHDDAFGELKAALEGSLSARRGNSVIYATSNRRHLIKENFSDRENDVHRSDTLQEELSLSDRFGLAVNFLNPGKSDYLDIVEKIADDRGLKADRQLLFDKAEKWALRRAGRSPRCAKQFIDYVESCEKRSVAW